MQQTADNGQSVYVVDDDVSITRLIAMNLTAYGYQPKVFHDGYEALDNLENDRPDLVLLDLVMPHCNGLEITRLIRLSSSVPIIVLSVRNEIATKLAALDLGADDYVTKPFRLDEFLARVSAVLRRTSNAGSSPGKRMKVTSHRRKVNLTYREWHTLRVLINSPGRVVSPESLLREAGGKGNGAGGGCYQNLHLSFEKEAGAGSAQSSLYPAGARLGLPIG
ncbi:MAG TPA: response regulator transcription factor [Dehalococcoidia bacterium]|nr:response regulator transcription factor [Dehalococcoidia bacterium]